MSNTSPPPALTTTFVAKNWCTNSIYLFTDVHSGHDCVIGTTPVPCQFYQLGATAYTSDCLPSGYEPGRSFYYSPGICPSGYSLACSSTVEGETQGTCCPTNYGCLSDSTGFYWFSTDQCVWAVPPTVQFIYQTSAFGGDWGTLTATGGGQTAINALGIGIRYKQSDLAPKTSTSSPSTTTSRASESATTPPWQIHSSGLAAGAKAGIAVGAVVAALIVLGLLLFCVRRRRKARAANHMTGDGNQSADDYQRRGPDNVGQYRDLHSPSSKAELESPLPDLSERESYMQPTARGRAQLYNQQSPTELA